MRTIIIILATINIILFVSLSIRQVKAEDECIDGVLAVERLPIVGLVCILE